MSVRTRIVATMAALLLAIASVGAVSARNGNLTTGTTFNVFNDGSPSSGEQVVVTRQATWKGNNWNEQCTKTDADTCVGSVTYVREYAGAPWLVQ